MQDVNSTQQFDKLTHTLEEEEREIKDIENVLRRKESDHHRAKEIFEKVDKEMKDLEQKRDNLLLLRTNLQNEFKNLQRNIETMNKRGGIQPKI